MFGAKEPLDEALEEVARLSVAIRSLAQALIDESIARRQTFDQLVELAKPLLARLAEDSPPFTADEIA